MVMSDTTLTQQYFDPKDPHPNLNGFNALKFYDSNHDGLIDSKDVEWPKLLVWIDKNHDGISQPDELHHLDDVGIHSLSLAYENSPKVDKYGNQFRLRGTLNPDASDDVDRVIYDVTLTTKK